MLGLDNSQMETTGLNFILSRLSPASPFGVEKMKQLTPFRNREEALICFDNIEKIIPILKKDGLEELSHLLWAFKNIRRSVCNTRIFSQVELFEIKYFLLNFEKLLRSYGRLFRKSPLARIHLQPMDEALAILDPEGQRIAAFTLDSPKLQEIRKEKQRVEALDILSSERFALVEKETAEESRVLEELAGKLREHIPVFLSNMDNIGILDFTIAKARLALEYDAVRPKIGGGEVLSLQNMWNPYVEDALINKEMTRISISMDKGVTIITGANMGGKSVALKTAVLNTVLCQLGFFIFAKDAEIPLFDGIYLISEDMPDIGRGLSGFGAEIQRFNEISKRRDFLFIALDEFARGTNPEEGAAIVRGVASYLSESDSISVMTTHYDRVVSQKFKHYQVAGLSLPKTSQDAEKSVSAITAHMDYALVEAGPDTLPPRDALNICKMIGLNKDVLDKLLISFS
ncbi:MAG: hypothetical protein FWB91_12410 [Defluviitaleaceae bacterium]|nr:hypothetical protein [Defluviitaleaceae bacterium]